jgi:hypothetical protein
MVQDLKTGRMVSWPDLTPDRYHLEHGSLTTANDIPRGFLDQITWVDGRFTRKKAIMTTRSAVETRVRTTLYATDWIGYQVLVLDQTNRDQAQGMEIKERLLTTHITSPRRRQAARLPQKEPLR